MPNRPLRRKVIPLLFVITLTAAWASAAGPQAGKPRPTRDAAPILVEWVGRALGLLASVWGKTGCQIDPNGLCGSSPAEPPLAGDRTDTGCNIDPDGRCISVPAVLAAGQRDEGCNIDPNGNCR